jgi:hypothetical protein
MIIYKLTNLINGKSYIGQTRRSVEVRWKQHCYRFKDKMAIDLAIKKYGQNNFKIEIIASVLKLEYLDEVERLLIKQHNTLYPNGYNLTDGGSNGHIITDETKKRMSESAKIKLITKEHREKIRLSHIGFKHSIETKRKISLAKKGKKLGPMHSEEMKKQWSVEQTGSGNRFFGRKHSPESIAKMSKSKKGCIPWNRGIPHTEDAKRNISESLKGKPVWNKGIPRTEETKQKIRDTKRRNREKGMEF